jgi:hypothetical protein
LNKYISNIQGTKKYKQEDGVLSTVEVSDIGLVLRTIRVTGLPPELKDAVLREALSKCGVIKDIKKEQWARKYKYSVDNG